MQGYQDRRIVVKSGSITLENSHLFNSHSNFTKKSSTPYKTKAPWLSKPCPMKNSRVAPDKQVRPIFFSHSAH